MASNGNHVEHNQDQVAVVVVPLQLQGHLNPLLQLSHLIASYKIPVYYVGFSSHNHQANARAYWLDQTSSDINMINLQDPTCSLAEPSKQQSSKVPVHVQLMAEVSQQLRHPISELLQDLTAKFRRIIVIHDSLMASVVQDVKDIPNLESYAFHTSSAFTVYFTILQLMDDVKEKPFDLGSEMLADVPGWEGFYSAEFKKLVADQYDLLKLSSGRLHNTCRSLESTYMDLLSKLPVNKNRRLYAIGPVNQLINASKDGLKNKHKCLDWLDQQDKDEVIYISFGTTTSMEEKQIRELAIGLERSQQKFLWVLRDADKRPDIVIEDGARKGHDHLPEGYEKRVEGRGLVVRDWAPQLEILGHPATGGFLSHCGWNSCLESFSMGVPIATWPIYADQPKNSVLITEVLKVGVCVKDWTQRDELITANVVENAVRRLMGSEEGEEIRRRARELGAAVRTSAAKGGSSALELDSFVAHITR